MGLLHGDYHLQPMQQTFVAGAYVYASEGRLPSGYEPEIVQLAFRPKR
jgi:hypothetical protein